MRSIEYDYVMEKKELLSKLFDSDNIMRKKRKKR